MTQTAMITGASRRLGLYLCEHLLAQGWRVHAITREASEDLLRLQSERLFIHTLGNYDARAIDRCIAEFRQHSHRLDLLVNNASIYENDSGLMSQGVTFYEALTFVHMTMPALLVSALISELSEAQGNIVSITDIYADNPNPEYSLYCSTKAGLQNLTLGFAKKFAPKVRANCIQPGPIKFLPSHDDAHQQQVLSETLLASEGGFAPVLQTLTFILNNTYLTGTCIKVDGGRSLVRG